MTILRPYIYRHTPYRPPPLYQGLRSRVLPGHRDPGSRVTMGYRVIGSQGYWVTGSLDHRVHHPRFLHYPYLQGHHGLGSWVTMGYHHPGSQGYHHHGFGSPESRVTGHHGLGLRVTMGHRVMGYHDSPSPGSRVTMVTGSSVTISYHHPGYPSPWVSGLGSLWSRVTGSPWSQGHPSPGISNLPSPGLQGYHHLRIRY